MDIGITTMSSKGQIVIPQEMREEFKIGEKMIVIKDEGRLVLKKATELDISGDLEFARKTEVAWKSFENGEFKEMEASKFLEEVTKW